MSGDVVAAYAEPSFGLPAKPATNQHVQGHVAEIVWSLLIDEAKDDGREIVYRTFPDSDVTSPGADGYVVFSTTDDALSSILWEIKKRDGAEGVDATIGAAYRQLKAKAPRYLAKVAGAAEPQDTDVARFIGQAVPHWQEGNDAVAPAVAVTSDESGLPDQAFETFHSHFPQFATRWQGCITGLGDFDAFAELVRRYVWTGL